MKRFVLFLILLCFLFLGCATARRKQYVQKHPQLSERIKNAILEGSICRGMTKAGVYAAWGSPDKVGKVTGFFTFAEEEWVYEFHDPQKNRFGEFTGITFWRHVFFRNEKVIDIKKVPQYLGWLDQGGF